MGNTVKAVVFLKNNGAQKEMVTTTNGSERVNVLFKVIQQGFKNDSSNEALKSQWPNKERNFGKAGPRWIDILEWHKYKVKLLDQKNRSKNESVKLIQNFPFYPSWNASHTK